MIDQNFLAFIRTRETDCPVCKEKLKDHTEPMLEACGFMIKVFKEANDKDSEPA